MKSIKVQNDKDPKHVALLLPEINHHKLNHGDETYRKCKMFPLLKAVRIEIRMIAILADFQIIS